MKDNIAFNPQVQRNGGSAFPAKNAPSKKPTKNFEKVLAKEKREGRGHPDKKEKTKEEPRVKGKETYEHVTDQLAGTERKEKRGQVSLFDLASTKEEKPVENIAMQEGEDVPISEFSEEVHQHSLSALFKGYGSTKRLKFSQKNMLEEPTPKTRTPNSPFSKTEQPVIAETGKIDESPRAGAPPVYAKSEKDYSSQFTQELPDLASVNPIAAPQSLTLSQPTTIQKTEEPQSIAPHLREVVDQLIDKLYTISREGRTDTFITLKHPPILSGSNLIITGFDTAKGEFNLSFENLTQEAKLLLDAQENQNSLQFALEKKGFVMHILTTTTVSETQILVSGEKTAKDPHEGDENPHDQGQGKRDQKEKESE